MRVKITETKVYQFNELTEDQQDKAIEKLYDINVDYEWWQFVCDDAEQIGLKITAFDLDRGNYVKGEFILSAAEVAANIVRDHGKQTETFKTAQAFLDEINSNPTPDDSDEFSEWEDKMLELEDEFLKSLLEYYRIILSRGYDYITSREAIIETIQANGYEFDDDGNIA